MISLQWNETHNRGILKLDTWRLSFTYIKNQKHSRMKIFAKITSRQMGSWSRTFLTYHDFCTGLRETSVLNYFAGCRPWQQRVSGTFIVTSPLTFGKSVFSSRVITKVILENKVRKKKYCHLVWNKNVLIYKFRLPVLWTLAW